MKLFYKKDYFRAMVELQKREEKIKELEELRQ